VRQLAGGVAVVERGFIAQRFAVAQRFVVAQCFVVARRLAALIRVRLVPAVLPRKALALWAVFERMLRLGCMFGEPLRWRTEASPERVGAAAEGAGIAPEIGCGRPCSHWPQRRCAGAAFERYAVTGDAQAKNGGGCQQKKLKSPPLPRARF
jgi:hypothetical protein